MTQPAKVQEPSMEEILASIRRIIADDEAKPPAAEKPATPSPPAEAKPEKPAAAPAAKAPVMKDIPPSTIPAAQAAAKTVAPPPVKPAPAPAPAPAASNSQDDIDAMLAGLDEATSAGGDTAALARWRGVRTHRRDGGAGRRRKLHSTRSSRTTISNLPKLPQPERCIGSLRSNRRRSKVRAPQQILSRSTVSAVESAFNTLAHTVLSNNARTLEDLVKEMLRPMLKSWLDDNLPGLVERIVKAEIERVSRGR